jgi:glycosyltransferase involved in cell wall biosynthesis
MVCVKGLGPLAAEVENNGVPVSLTGMGGLRYLSPIARLRSKMLRERPDIVHTHNLLAHTHAAPAARTCGIPVVHTKHGRQVTSFSSFPWLRRYIYGLADRIAVVSRDTGKSLMSKVDIDAAKVTVVYNGIDTARFGSADGAGTRRRLGIAAGAAVAGAVSRLDPVKDHATMLRAFASAAEDDEVFLIVGDGPERANIERLAGELGITDRVVMAGFSDDIPGMLAAMDIYLQPSTEEGLSLTILEAAAAGVPVVSTSVGGTPEIITDGVHGVLIEPGDVEALARVLKDFISDRKPFLEMASKARTRIEEVFSLEGMARGYDSLYRQVLSERGVM